MQSLPNYCGLSVALYNLELSLAQYAGNLFRHLIYYCDVSGLYCVATFLKKYIMILNKKSESYTSGSIINMVLMMVYNTWNHWVSGLCLEF
jgi:hypothetical protein